MPKFIIGIDATNLLSGGGRTHLIEILNHFDIRKSMIEKLIVFGRNETLDLISDRSWIEKISIKSLEGSVFTRTIWQLKNLKYQQFSSHNDHQNFFATLQFYHNITNNYYYKFGSSK